MSKVDVNVDRYRRIEGRLYSPHGKDSHGENIGSAPNLNAPWIGGRDSYRPLCNAMVKVG
jgi:hypothetical protein